MYRIAEIKGLLSRHGYVPVVRKTGDGIVFYLPARACEPRFVEAYTIRRGREPGLYYNSSTHPDEKFVSVPEHAIRLFLMADISACCGRVPISDELVCYLDDEGRDRPSIEAIVDPPSSDNERGKEGFLTRLILQARAENFPLDIEQVALTHGVHEGYRLIKSFFEVRRS